MIEDWLSYNEAMQSLKKRLDHFIMKSENPFVARFLHEHADKPIQTRMDMALMTKLAQYLHLTGAANVSEAVRQLVEVGLRQYEKQHNVSLSLKPIEFPDELPPEESFNPVEEAQPVAPEPEPDPMEYVPPEEPEQSDDEEQEQESLVDESWVF